jgi:hypothetical protein
MATILWNRNIADEAHQKMIELSTAGHQLLWVAFPPAGGNSWSVITDQTFFNRNIPNECHDKMLDMKNSGHKLRLVSFPPQGGNRWSIVSDTSFYNRNVAPECHMILGEIYTCHGPVRCLAYDPDKDGWSVLASAKSAVIYRLPFADDGGWSLSNANWDDPTSGHGNSRTGSRRSPSISTTRKEARFVPHAGARSTPSSNRSQATAGEAPIPAIRASGITWSSNTATARSVCTGI